MKGNTIKVVYILFFHLTYSPMSARKYKCAVFNHEYSNTQSKCNDIVNCEKYKECEYCTAYYANDIKSVKTDGSTPPGVIPQIADCNFPKHDSCRGMSVGHCVLRHNMKHVHSCCCTGDYCNKNITIIPGNLIPVPKTTQHTLIEPPPVEKPRSNKILYYALPPVFGTVIVLAVLQRLWRKHKRAMSRGAPLLPTSPPQTPPLQHRPIQFQEIVSRGQFGFVWKALYEGKNVAVKIIPLHERASWDSEQNMYSNYRLRHDNILSFHSAEKRCPSDVIQYWIITEYHPHGSLADYLSSNTLTFEDVTTFALSIVAGLVYLHGEDLSASPPKPIIAHRDFKSRNVLVKNNLTCCVSDFGSACAFPKDYKRDEARAQVGTKRYMAPEVLQGAVAFQAEAFLCIDVYALALVLWELLSRCSLNQEPVSPYRAPYEDEVGSHPTIEDMIITVVNKNLRPVVREEWGADVADPLLVEYVNAMVECWDDDGDARLTSHCVLERLSLIETTLHSPDPPQSPHFPPSGVTQLTNIERVELFDEKRKKPNFLSSSSGYLSDRNSRDVEHLC